MITHFVAFYLIFLNIASDAPVAPEEGTQMRAYMQPRYSMGGTSDSSVLLNRKGCKKLSLYDTLTKDKCPGVY